MPSIHPAHSSDNRQVNWRDEFLKPSPPGRDPAVALLSESVHVLPPKPVKVLITIPVQLTFETDKRNGPAQKNQHFGTQGFQALALTRLERGAGSPAILGEPFGTLGHPAVHHCDRFCRQRVSGSA